MNNLHGSIETVDTENKTRTNQPTKSITVTSGSPAPAQIVSSAPYFPSEEKLLTELRRLDEQLTEHEEKLLAELRHLDEQLKALNEQLEALRQIAEGPIPERWLDVLLDLRKMAAKALGWTVTK